MRYFHANSESFLFFTLRARVRLNRHGMQEQDGFLIDASPFLEFAVLDPIS